MFDENSGLVKTWVRLIRKKDSKYIMDNVPDIGSLREAVEQVINGDNK